MTARTSHSGGCQCGAVRYRTEAELGYPHLCHCRMCQKAAGNYFMPLASANRSDFAITRGEPSWFHSSDLVRRGFCSACGTPLFFDTPGAAAINIVLGSLDDPASIKPVAQSNLDAKLPWFHLLDTLAEEPPELDADRRKSVLRSNRQHPDHDTPTWPLEEQA